MKTVHNVFYPKQQGHFWKEMLMLNFLNVFFKALKTINAIPLSFYCIGMDLDISEINSRQKKNKNVCMARHKKK